MPTTKSGYINGSDLLLSVGGKAVGHCTSHTTNFNTETKDRAVKPVQAAAITKALFKGKGVTGLSVSISADGLRNFSEAESGFKTFLGQWAVGSSVEVKAFEREGDTTPYMSGNFIISSLTENAPGEDDATYSVSLENDGPVTITANALTGEA